MPYHVGEREAFMIYGWIGILSVTSISAMVLPLQREGEVHDLCVEVHIAAPLP